MKISAYAYINPRNVYSLIHPKEALFAPLHITYFCEGYCQSG